MPQTTKKKKNESKSTYMHKHTYSNKTANKIQDTAKRDKQETTPTISTITIYMKKENKWKITPKKQLKNACKFCGNVLSSVSTSLLKRLTILPAGVVSKNEDGAWRIFNSIVTWSECEAKIHPMVKVNADTNFVTAITHMCTEHTISIIMWITQQYHNIHIQYIHDTLTG